MKLHWYITYFCICMNSAKMYLAECWLTLTRQSFGQFINRLLKLQALTVRVRGPGSPLGITLIPIKLCFGANFAQPGPNFQSYVSHDSHQKSSFGFSFVQFSCFVRIKLPEARAWTLEIINKNANLIYAVCSCFRHLLN